MDLVVFTNYSPFKKYEPFLVSELEYTKEYFSSIAVLSMYDKNEDSTSTAGKKIIQFQPIFKPTYSKKSILFRGLFNLAPFNYHCKEFFSALLYPKKRYWFFISFLITRLTLSSKAFTQFSEMVNRSEKLVLYFYWGDNLCWTLPYLIKKFGSKKFTVVIRLHGSDLYENVKGDYSPLRKEIFSLSNLLVTVSENGKNYLLEKYPEITNKIMVSRLGVSDNGLNHRVKKDFFTIVSVSNIVALKRLHLIFEALQLIKLNVNWIHFGDGPLAQELKELTKKRKGNLSIQFKGHVDNSVIIDFYKTQTVDLFLNVSSTEGVPVSIMEALSFGIPVIAPNVGGISELVDDSIGKLMDADFKVTDLASSIENILNSSSTEVLRENARKVFEEKISAEKNYRGFYETLMSKIQEQ